GAHDDGQRRIGDQGLDAGGGCVAGEAEVDPVGVLPGVRRCGGAGPGCAGDLDQGQAVPAAEFFQAGVGGPCGQHGGAAGQDRVQPGALAVGGRYQRVGDQAAGPQRGGDAGGGEAPGGGLQGAGLEPWGGRGTHEFADPVAADGRGQGDPA